MIVNKKLIMFLWLITSTLSGIGQENHTIRGKIINAVDSLPIEGATVRAKGNRLVNTDPLGNFELVIIPGDTNIKVSHVAFESRTMQLSSSDLDVFKIISLNPLDRAIEEVLVSTGYEEIPLERVTGSFSVIDRKTLDQEVGFEVISRLDHLVTGVYFDRVGGSFNDAGKKTDQRNLSIHGISTLRSTASGANMPLIVMDNFPFDGDINDINPAEIENITILKDAAATSIWGAKAGNGVIVISTYKGKYNNPIRANFSSTIGITEKPALFMQQMVSMSDLIDLEKFLFSKGFYTAQENSRSKPALPPVVETLILQRDGVIDDIQANKIIDDYKTLDARSDLLKYAYRLAQHQQHSLTVTGGKENYKFSFGVGYDRSLPIEVRLQHDRFTIKMNQTVRLFSKTELHSGLRWLHSSSDEAPVIVGYGEGMKFPYSMLADKDGNPIAVPHDYRMSFLDTAGQGMLLDWQYRPLEEITNYSYQSTLQNLKAIFGLRQQILDELSVDFNYTFSRGATNTRNLDDINGYRARDRINRGTEISDGRVTHHFPLGSILSKSNSIRSTHSGRVQINYQHAIGRSHSIRALLGTEVQQNIGENHGGYTTYGYNKDNLTQTTLIDHNLRYPVFGNLAANERIGYPIRSEEFTINRFVSYYANANYTFLDRYIVSGSIRKDASNLFGVHANDRWTPLWSVGVAWNMHEEPILRNHSIVDKLRIRASYGYSGNVDQTMSALTTIRYENNPGERGVSSWPVAALVNTPPNPDLRWEKVGNWNLGLNIGISNRWSAIIDVYNKFTKDLLQSMLIDQSTGHGSMVLNIANTRSSGIDINLQGLIFSGKFNWNSNLLFSYNNNYITKSYATFSTPSVYVNPGGLRHIEGEMAFPAYSYRWAGLDPDSGVPRGYLGGEISTDYRGITSNQTTLDDLVFHGSARPLYYGSIRNQFIYGDWSVAINLTYRLGYYFRRSGMDYLRMVNNQFGHKDYYNRWQQPGDEKMTHIPVFNYPVDTRANTFYLASEVLMEPGDHLRLQDIRVSYMVQEQAWLPARLNIFASMHNIGILWRANKLGLDPEMSGMIPNPKNINVGIHLNF